MKNIVVVFFVLMIQISCSAPAQKYPDKPSPTVTVLISQVAKRGQENLFFVYAVAGSICHIGVSYYNVKLRWITVTLPDVTADSNGKCEWKWTIPEGAKDGVAELRGYVEAAGQDDVNLFPQQFCIESCP